MNGCAVAERYAASLFIQGQQSWLRQLCAADGNTLVTFRVRAPELPVDLGQVNCGWVVKDGGTIVTTRDGGTHWEPQKGGTDKCLFGVPFADAHGLGAKRERLSTGHLPPQLGGRALGRRKKS
jgi:hypothetical protein